MAAQTFPFQIGSIDACVLNDGEFQYDQPADLFFGHAPSKQSLSMALNQQGIKLSDWDHMDSSFCCLYLKMGRERILIDPGAGKMGANTGQLLSALETQGVKPEDIDTIIITHCHPDHIGGILNEKGELTFPNAKYIMWKAEWDFWTHEPDLSHQPIPADMQAAMISSAQQICEAIREKTELIRREFELRPGMRVISIPGHTPGMIALNISSDGQQFMYLADAVFHPTQIEHPDWSGQVDLDPKKAAASRNQILKRASNSRSQVLCYHFPFPGLGTIENTGGAYHFKAVAAGRRA
ncbi:MBL fold metallo-hydrolase [Pontibacter sp. G13]|uniref:MBL fold metallo-hydrolase n=1 Tax=Pontibacter sp. G13 TaxID=3074898 RepID=UPI00288BB122|nr:MBL fold metallo-hydrolase [Pontibacter sp. G13]WNJ20861.1 MBL fold metallo-hydrolase [Pontibacter sp. G13]